MILYNTTITFLVSLSTIWFLSKCHSFSPSLSSSSSRIMALRRLEEEKEHRHFRSRLNVRKNRRKKSTSTPQNEEKISESSQNSKGLDGENDDELSQYSIDNEVALQHSISMIKDRDRGIKTQEQPFTDLIKIAEVIFTKTLDTIEDALLMLKRKMNQTKNIPADVLDEWNDPSLSHKPRLLVIGSGWASHAFIKVVDTDKYRVLNVSPTNYFVFTPMLASSSVGTTEIRSIVESVRDSNPTVRFMEGSAIDIDPEMYRAQVKLGDDSVDDDNKGRVIDLDYDILVYGAGVGALTSSIRTPGLSKNNVHFLKTVNDARRLRRSVISLLERASQPNVSEEERKKLLTFVVIGAGPTGVEYTGELSDFLVDVTGFGKGADGIKRSIAPFANLSQYTRVILVQGAKDILPQFDEKLRVSAKKAVEEAGAEVLTSTRVTRIESNEKLFLSTEVKKGDKIEIAIECGLIVWAGGTKPVKLTEQLISNVDSGCERKYGMKKALSDLSINGRIPVDKWLRVLGTPGNLLAMGDAAVTVGDGTSVLPQTAQVAAQQGAYLARLLNRGYNVHGNQDYSIKKHSNGKEDSFLYLDPPMNNDAISGNFLTKLQLRGSVEAKPFEFLNLGQLAYLGGGQALNQVSFGDNNLFDQIGDSAFLLWRSVYIVKQVSTKSRLLVLFDWFSTKIFGRDVTRN